jgi:hypothetical protein
MPGPILFCFLELLLFVAESQLQIAETSPVIADDSGNLPSCRR